VTARTMASDKPSSANDIYGKKFDPPPQKGASHRPEGMNQGRQ
jgi:hypothetical protein